jgi:LPXTG-motif cell wall-anchored protein
MGQLASKGTEMLAEEGMPDLLASEIKGSATDVQTTKAHLLPGDSITVKITTKPGDMLSAATMLIQTNDGFTGLDSVALTDGNIDTMAYDAGTEVNTELKADVPGPPFGGKNHGSDPNPHEAIAMHPGIASNADVTPDFKWSGAVARFTIHEITAPVAAPGAASYDVTITNINSGMQGLSPLVLATHPASTHAWQMGQLASKGTELLAEEGMPDMLASEVKGAATDVQTTKAHLLPGDSITVRIRANPGDMLSAATMLIQTNDGFTGLDAVPVAVGNTDTMAYDAGTEINTELKADVPGPPFGGKNHGPDPNPHEAIAMHPGIAANADVTADFKWSGAVARFTIAAVSSAPAPVAPVAASTPVATALPAMGVPGESATPSTSDGSGAPVPSMPHTGASDTGIWALVLAAGALLLVSLGLLFRRTSALRRR